MQKEREESLVRGLLLGASPADSTPVEAPTGRSSRSDQRSEREDQDNAGRGWRLAQCRQMDDRERDELVHDLVDALRRLATVDGARLADLMRAEQGLQEALRVVRREIAFIVDSARSASADEVPPRAD